MALKPFMFILAVCVFGVGAIYVLWKRRHMPTWRAGFATLLGGALIMFARAMQLASSDPANRLIWYKLYLLGLLILPTGFVVLTMRYAGLGYLITPRLRVLISVFPFVSAMLILTNEYHGWVWDPQASREFTNELATLSVGVARFWYWVFIAYSYMLMGLGSYFLFRVRVRTVESSKWKVNLIAVGSILVTVGPLLDIFHASPLPPFFASFLGILVGAILMFFNISPLRKRDLLFITRGAIIQNMSDPVFVVDKDNCLIDINPAAEGLLHQTKSLLLGETIDVAFPDLRAVWQDHLSLSGEVVLAHTQPPQTFDYRISQIKDWQDQVISQMIVLRDITERKRVDAELSARREAERNFSKQLTVLVKVTQTLSKAETLDELCRQAIEMGRDPLGYDRLAIWFVTENHDWMLGTFGTSIHGEITDERDIRHPIHPTTRMIGVLQGKEEIQVYEEVPLYQADGQQVGTGIRITAALWDGTTVIGFLSVDNHIRHLPLGDHDKEIIRLYASVLGHLCTLKRAQEALFHLTETLEHRVVERTQELETVIKELEAFAYSISHDLRAPIRAVDGYTSLLMENYNSALDGEGQRILTTVQNEARRMGRLIDDLLAFSRFSRTELRKTCLDMETLAKSVAEELTLPEDTARVEILIEKLHSAWGDYSLLQQVWTNLISNAVKFTSKRQKAMIYIQSSLEDGSITYCVRDNGVGFDMTYAHKLFGVFQRLHSESDYPGTGAGLAIVHRIITRHGGKIWAKSEEGVGTTFFFTLPHQI